MADAKSAAINRLPESAEQRLSGLNRSRAGTAEWHLEIAQRLIHLATDLATEAKTASVRPIAERALHNTVLAERLAQKPDLRAAAKTMTGFIQDRFLGDRRAALLSYREAAQLSPKAHQAQHQEANLGLWLAREEQKGGPRP